MSEVALVFPHQLFKKNPALHANRKVILVEEWLFFRQYDFHQQKILLHRSGMKNYEVFLKEQSYMVDYVESTDERNDVRALIATLPKEGISEIHIVDVVDCWLMKRITEGCKKYELALVVHPSPSFLLTHPEVVTYAKKRKTYFQTDFYIEQRKKRNLLIEADGKPVGGKWTFDAEN